MPFVEISNMQRNGQSDFLKSYGNCSLPQFCLVCACCYNAVGGYQIDPTFLHCFILSYKYDISILYNRFHFKSMDMVILNWPVRLLFVIQLGNSLKIFLKTFISLNGALRKHILRINMHLCGLKINYINSKIMLFP